MDGGKGIKKERLAEKYKITGVREEGRIGREML